MLPGLVSLFALTDAVVVLDVAESDIDRGPVRIAASAPRSAVKVPERCPLVAGARLELYVHLARNATGRLLRGAWPASWRRALPWARREAHEAASPIALIGHDSPTGRILRGEIDEIFEACNEAFIEAKGTGFFCFIT